MRAGGPWRGLGVFERIFEAISGEPDFEYALIDGTIVSVHQKASGAKGGLTTKVLALTDVLGNLVRFKLLPGQRSESTGAPELIEGLWFDALLADIDVSPDLISAVTNAVLDEVAEWQNRPLGNPPLDICYAIVFFGYLRVKIRDEGFVLLSSNNTSGTRL